MSLALICNAYYVVKLNIFIEPLKYLLKLLLFSTFKWYWEGTSTNSWLLLKYLSNGGIQSKYIYGPIYRTYDTYMEYCHVLIIFSASSCSIKMRLDARTVHTLNKIFILSPCSRQGSCQAKEPHPVAYDLIAEVASAAQRFLSCSMQPTQHCSFNVCSPWESS